MFVKRLAEECGYVFVGSFALALQTSGDFSTAALSGAVIAGGRAVVGVIAKRFGADKDKPSLTA